MTIQLPEDLEQYLRSEVLKGRFASEGEAVAEAVRLLRESTQPPTAPTNSLTEQQWAQRLVDSGLLANLPPDRAAACPRRDFQPVPIEGEPLSETVIRQRR